MIHKQQKHCCRGGVGAGGDADKNDDSSGISLPSSHQCIDKGKRLCRGRSKTPSPPLVLTEDERLANCLLLLSMAPDNPVLRITDSGECSTSGRKEVDQVVLPPPSPQPEESRVLPQTPPIARLPYECKTCQKCFASHQALGGHRASHKKVKGCFATWLEVKSPKIKRTPIGGISNNRNNQVGSSSENVVLALAPFVETSSQRQLPKKKSKVHKCPICYRQFPSGQALGGHKRRHWKALNSRAAAVEPLIVVATELLQAGNSSSGLNAMPPHTGTLRQMFRSSNYALDLNMPAPVDDFPGITLLLDMPTAVYLQPGRDNESDNALNVNIEEEAGSREVRLTNLSDLININERESGSTWLQIGIGSRADQP